MGGKKVEKKKLKDCHCLPLGEEERKSWEENGNKMVKTQAVQ